ncbi:trypsin alpha-like isoform X2 [Amblyomma americanum]
MQGNSYPRNGLGLASTICMLVCAVILPILTKSAAASEPIDGEINPEGCGRVEPRRRIAGGTPITKLDAPWIVFVQAIHAQGTQGSVITCGGSIITRNVVLTAAHCLQYPDLPIQWVRIFYNTTNGAQGPLFYAESKAVHASYTSHTGLGYDIALLKTTEMMPIDRFVRPICLPTKYIEVGNKKVFAAGYGATDMTETVKGALMYARLNALRNSDCRYQLAHHPPFGRNTRNTLCTMGYGKDICLGDSGGPLTLNSRGLAVQVGVASSSYDCSGSEGPSTFVRVSTYASWIQDQLKSPENWEKLNVVPLHILK